MGGISWRPIKKTFVKQSEEIMHKSLPKVQVWDVVQEGAAVAAQEPAYKIHLLILDIRMMICLIFLRKPIWG